MAKGDSLSIVGERDADYIVSMGEEFILLPRECLMKDSVAQKAMRAEPTEKSEDPGNHPVSSEQIVVEARHMDKTNSIW